MSVPEPEKGNEDDQDEEGPEPVLLIRLDEADALVHLKSMVSCLSLSPPPFPLSLSTLGHGLRGNENLPLGISIELMGVICLSVFLFFPLSDRH